MDTKIWPELIEHFAALPDPRTGPAVRHKFVEIVFIAICATIGGADDWVGVAEYGRGKLQWLQSFLELPGGIPSHDTFGRVFAQLDPERFGACFAAWVSAIADRLPGQCIAIDGKTLRRSHDRSQGKGALHLVSAWAAGNHLVLGQVQVDDKSNEITAIPQLLRKLDIRDCIITIDAMGCQREIVAQIKKQGGEYLLAVKDNQPRLAERIEILFAHAKTREGQQMERSEYTTVEKGHGRVETRCCTALMTSDWGFYLDPQDRWEGLCSIVRVEATRQTTDETSTSVRYFISSLGNDAVRALGAIREHWGIENRLHWVLDIAFREDESRIRKGHGAHNFSLLRRLALIQLKRESTLKVGIANKRQRAGWDNAYLAKVLAA